MQNPLCEIRIRGSLGFLNQSQASQDFPFGAFRGTIVHHRLMENHRLVLPEHLNQFGFLFGGHLLMWVDEIAWMAATLEYEGAHFVTVAMDEVSFRHGVRQGAILRIETNRVRTGRTSVTYAVKVQRELEIIFTTSVTLVHVDDAGVKQALPTI
jgi:acyl-CoA hydrolase